MQNYRVFKTFQSEPDVSIEIIIEDENDNSPIFVPASLIGNVLESAVVGKYTNNKFYKNFYL